MSLEKSTKNIQSVQRAIDIVNCFDKSARELTLNEISEMVKINVNTARGLVNTLLNNGFLSKNITTKRYSLGYEFLLKSQLINQFLVQHIRDIAYPLMEAFANDYRLSCWLQISFYKDVFTVEVVMPKNSYYTYTPRTGTRLPLHSTASGKLLVANLPFDDMVKTVESIVFEKFTKYTISNKDTLYKTIDQVLKAGYATEHEETDLSVSSVSAPFFSAKGVMAGTISFVAPTPTTKSLCDDAIVGILKIADLVTSKILGKI